MKKTVLVIDNDANAASLISKTLEAEGYLVFTASSGDMALTMAKKVTPLLVFLNLATPGTNGLEICKSIRSIGPLKNVPLVLLTLRESKFDSRYKTLYGIVGFLRKPFASSDIISKVSSILSHDVAAEAFPEPPKEEGFMESDTAKLDSGRHEPVSVSDAFNAYEMPEETIHDEIMPDEIMPEGITLEQTVLEEPAFKPQETFSMPVKEKPPVKESPQPFKAGTEESPGFQISGDKGLGDPFKEKFPGGDFPSETTGMSSAAAGEKIYGQGKKLKTTNRMIMPVAAVAAGLIALVAYMFLKPAATAPGRKPAGTVIAKNMPSKPLKKPQAFLPSITPMVEAALEKPKPAEEIKPPAAKPLPIAYFVQFGVFTVEQNATALQQELKAKGQEALIHQTTLSGKPAYRVVAAKLNSKHEAISMARKITASKNIETAITKEGSATAKTAVSQPAAKPLPEKEVEKRTEKGIAYFVQFGVFTVEQNANALQQELKAKGQEASIHQTTLSGKPAYRVVAAKLSSKHEAISMARKITASKNIETAITKEAR